MKQITSNISHRRWSLSGPSRRTCTLMSIIFTRQPQHPQQYKAHTTMTTSVRISNTICIWHLMMTIRLITSRLWACQIMKTCTKQCINLTSVRCRQPQPQRSSNNLRSHLRSMQKAVTLMILHQTMLSMRRYKRKLNILRATLKTITTASLTTTTTSLVNRFRAIEITLTMLSTRRLRNSFRTKETRLTQRYAQYAISYSEQITSFEFTWKLTRKIMRNSFATLRTATNRSSPKLAFKSIWPSTPASSNLRAKCATSRSCFEAISSPTKESIQTWSRKSFLARCVRKHSKASRISSITKTAIWGWNILNVKFVKSRSQQRLISTFTTKTSTSSPIINLKSFFAQFATNLSRRKTTWRFTSKRISTSWKIILAGIAVRSSFKCQTSKCIPELTQKKEASFARRKLNAGFTKVMFAHALIFLNYEKDWKSRKKSKIISFSKDFI